MKRLLSTVLLLIVASAVFAGDVDTKTGTFEDGARNRKIPYRIYFPKSLDKQYPVIIVSHGLGGSRDGNQALGKNLASRGFITIHVQHAGSDESVYAGARDRRAAEVAMQRARAQPINAINRFQDIPFVMEQLPKLNAEDETLKGHLNLQSIGIAGHSYGSISAMVAAGERVGERYTSFKVPAIRAALSLSPSPPTGGNEPSKAYADISIPIFHMTGTDDVTVLSGGYDVQAKERLVPYQSLNIQNQYLLVLNKADHITFSGSRIGGRDERKLDKEHMTAVVNGAILFFEAYLKDNKEAEKYLRTEFKKALKPEDRFEFK